MKCPHCKAEIALVDSMHGHIVCNEPERHYWLENPTTVIVTRNGEEIPASLHGDLRKAHGIGRTRHTCFEEVLQ